MPLRPGITPLVPASAGFTSTRLRHRHHLHRYHLHRHHSQPNASHPDCHRLKRPFSATRTAKIPSYIVTCKDDATPEQVQAAKQHAIDQGGKIEHEYSIIKGFSVSFSKDAVTTLESNEYVKSVESDGVMRTQ